jgi:DNA-directed RNA polymerase subunit RPC12/RpoP
MRTAGKIVAAVLVVFGILFLLSARAEYTKSPGGRIITGLVLIGIGAGMVVAIKRSEPRPGQKIEVVQKIDLTGGVKADQMKCQQCGAPLSKDAVSVREGAVFINCPYCNSTYQITEQPKW